MHKYLYNEAIFEVELRPRTPLLIKSGVGEDALDPTLPSMSFVRTARRGPGSEEVYIPGSSLRGVVRSHGEKLVRSIRADVRGACDPTKTGADSQHKACFAAKDGTKSDGPEVYTESCYACRLFGNTALASRLRLSDLYLGEQPALLERRAGVAIDRVTGAVAQGPFDLELVTDARFAGQLTLRNFTLGQLGLLAASLLDIGDGLVPLGFGKSKGMGRVELSFTSLTIRTARNPENAICGVDAFVSPEDHAAYEFPERNVDRFLVTGAAGRERGFYTLRGDNNQARAWLEAVAGHWVAEVEALR
jgi:CRISPR-associated protein Csm3